MITEPPCVGNELTQEVWKSIICGKRTTPGEEVGSGCNKERGNTITTVC